MTAVATSPGRSLLPAAMIPPARVHVLRRKITSNKLLWWLLPALALYLTAGALLAFRYSSFNGDAQARTANAYYVLFSRDPHLAAVGFVWNPLPSLSNLPVLLFSRVWPALSERAFAGNIMSAIFMAGAVVQLRGMLADFRVRRSTATLITVLFALHPMIVYYGGNGMSEALFLFTLMGATRHLLQYLHDRCTSELVRAGIWLAFAYYARNEAAAAIGFAGLVVLSTALVRARGAPRSRAWAAVNDAVIFGLPPLFAFVSWAVASYMIVGHPFEQFSSEYGTSSQLSLMQASGSLGASWGFAVKMAVLMAPLAVPAALFATHKAIRRKDPRVLGALAILGGVLAFAVVAFAERQTAGWFRYFISAAPLAAVLTGLCFADTATVRPSRKSTGPRSRTWLRAAATLAAVSVLVGASIAGAGVAMADPNIGREEHIHLAWIFRPAKVTDYADKGRFGHSVDIARYLDGLHLPSGSIVTDTFDGCVPDIILASRHPHQFIITNDRDFKPILADPVSFKARYLLIPEPVGDGALDATNRAYPGIYYTGAQIATKVREFTGPGCGTFRLYAVNQA